MTTIKKLQAGANMPRIVPSIDIEKVREYGRNTNIIISTAYISMLNSATCFIHECIVKLRESPFYRQKLKFYVNRTSQNIKKLDTSLKYEFSTLDVWDRNMDLTDAISDKLTPICKKMYFAISNELSKTQAKDRDMLSNMIVGAILLRQAIILFDEVLEKMSRETMYDFRPYFGHLSAKCIEHPFIEMFMLVAKTYNIDALALTRTEAVRIGIDDIVNVMGDESTYREARESVENGN